MDSRALPAPLAQIASNAGVNGALVVHKILESDDPSFGYDALAGEYCDLVEAGIIDPTKVVRCALQNAASVSGLLLTTNALITEMEKEEPEAPGGGQGMY